MVTKTAATKPSVADSNMTNQQVEKGGCSEIDLESKGDKD
jgi:hypothetical protein